MKVAASVLAVAGTASAAIMQSAGSYGGASSYAWEQPSGGPVYGGGHSTGCTEEGPGYETKTIPYYPTTKPESHVSPVPDYTPSTVVTPVVYTTPIIYSTSSTPVAPVSSTQTPIVYTSKTPIVYSSSSTPVAPVSSTKTPIVYTSKTPVVYSSSSTPVAPVSSTQTPVVYSSSSTPVAPVSSSATPVYPVPSTIVKSETETETIYSCSGGCSKTPVAPSYVTSYAVTTVYLTTCTAGQTVTLPTGTTVLTSPTVYSHTTTIPVYTTYPVYSSSSSAPVYSSVSSAVYSSTSTPVYSYVSTPVYSSVSSAVYSSVSSPVYSSASSYVYSSASSIVSYPASSSAPVSSSPVTSAVHSTTTVLSYITLTATKSSVIYSASSVTSGFSTGAVGSSTAPAPSASCSNICVMGPAGANGIMKQLGDGQNRVGSGTGSESTGCYTLSGGGFTDSAGRGCILTGPTTQFQCDVGATPSTGFSISGSSITHSGSGAFYACPVNGEATIYNIYSQPVSGQQGCVQVSLSTAVNGQCPMASATPSSVAPSTYKSSGTATGAIGSSTAVSVPPYKPTTVVTVPAYTPSSTSARVTGAIGGSSSAPSVPAYQPTTMVSVPPYKPTTSAQATGAYGASTSKQPVQYTPTTAGPSQYTGAAVANAPAVGGLAAVIAFAALF